MPDLARINPANGGGEGSLRKLWLCFRGPQHSSRKGTARNRGRKPSFRSKQPLGLKSVHITEGYAVGPPSRSSHHVRLRQNWNTTGDALRRTHQKHTHTQRQYQHLDDEGKDRSHTTGNKDRKRPPGRDRRREPRESLDLAGKLWGTPNIRAPSWQCRCFVVDSSQASCRIT